MITGGNSSAHGPVSNIRVVLYFIFIFLLFLISKENYWINACVSNLYSIFLQLNREKKSEYFSLMSFVQILNILFTCARSTHAHTGFIVSFLFRIAGKKTENKNDFRSIENLSIIIQYPISVKLNTEHEPFVYTYFESNAENVGAVIFFSPHFGFFNQYYM